MNHHTEHPRKLFRSRSDKIFFGICGGLGEYFDVDPTIMRLAFVLLALASGIGIVAYIIFALVTPRKDALPGEAEAGAPPMKDKVKEFAEGTADYVAEGGKRLAEEVREGKGKRGGIAAFFGVILIILGVAFLLDNLFPYGYFHRKFLWPFVLVALGVLLLAKKK